MITHIATFYTHYGAIKFHSECIKADVTSKILPVPRALSSSCGVCVRFMDISYERAKGAEDLDACYLTLPDGVYQKEYTTDKE